MDEDEGSNYREEKEMKKGQKGRGRIEVLVLRKEERLMDTSLEDK